MTVMVERNAQMRVEEFETIASRSPETVTLEFLGGRIGVKKVPDGDHDEIVKWLMKRCMQHRPDLWLYPERGLVVEAYRKGRDPRLPAGRPGGRHGDRAQRAGPGGGAVPRHAHGAVR